MSFPTDLKVLNAWGQIGVSVEMLVIFAGTIIVAFFLNNSEIMFVLVGVVAAKTSTVVDFWCGSSAGGQKKDETIEHLHQVMPPSPLPPEPSQQVTHVNVP